MRVGLGLGVLLLAGCVVHVGGGTGAFGRVRGDGVMREEPRPVGAFEKVSVCCGIDVEIKRGEKPSARVFGDQNLLPYVRTTVRGETLEIDVHGISSVSPTRALLVTLTTPRLTGLSASGGSNARADQTEGARVTLEASGGAEVEVAQVQAGHLDVDASGGGEVRTQGKASTTSVDVSGGATFDGWNLEVLRADVDVSGGADARMDVHEDLRGETSGGGTLKLRRHPQRHRVDESGGGDVDYGS